MRVILHVGAPKSGTTFLQRSMWGRKRELAAVGVRPAGRRARDMFHAAIEVRGTQRFWRLDPDELAGSWERICADALARPAPTEAEDETAARPPVQTVVMSHELLAAATADQAASALAALAGAEVHLLYTVRDLSRQVPSEWQERIKNGSTLSFAEFQHIIDQRFETGDTSNLFWRAHDVIDVADRWAAHLPPEQVHVVTTPAPGSPPDELWRRFATVVGFDADEIEPRTDKVRSNETLGAVQVGLLRQVNLTLDGRIPQPGYARFVKRYFSQGPLTQQSSERARCGPALLGHLIDLAHEQVAEIHRRGYQVVGDLDDLVPAADDAPAPDPDDLPDDLVAQAATRAVADLLVVRAEAEPPAAPPPPPPPPPSRRERLGAVARGLRGRLPGGGDR